MDSDRKTGESMMEDKEFCEHEVLRRAYMEEEREQFSYYYCEKCGVLLINMLSVTRVVSKEGIEHDQRLLEDARCKFGVEEIK